MAMAGLQSTIEQLRSNLADRIDDGQLLERYVSDRDGKAFATLVDRHGPKVFAVCLRVLGQHQLAEDAFQATFVVLAKKAHSIQPRSAVGGFLYGVARKAALEAFAVSRRRKETLVGTLPDSPYAKPYAIDSDVLALLDDEIANLSDTLRTAVVMCELDGVSRADAARQLGIAEGTLSSRLAAARKQLAAKLKARGVILSASLFTALASSATAVSPPMLGMASATVTAISGGVMKGMMLAKLKFATLGVVLMTSLFVAVSGYASKSGNEIGAKSITKAEQAEGLIWTHNIRTLELKAYTADGTEVKSVTLPESLPFYGLTHDGMKMAFGGKNGKGAKNGDNLTLHVGDISQKCESTDTGIACEWNDQFVFSPDNSHVVRVRYVPVGRGAYQNTLFDLAMKTETVISLPADHEVRQWAADGKSWRVMQSNRGADPKLPNYRWLSATVAHEPKLTPICDTVSLDRLDPSPDGKTFLARGYLHADADPWFKAVLMIDRDTGMTREVMRDEPHTFVGVRWSPDGKQIACLKSRLDTTNKRFRDSQLLLADTDGKNEKAILNIPDDGQKTRLLGWFPARTNITAPVPKEKPKIWHEETPIEMSGGRVTSVEYAPSGKSFAVCRSDGRIVFFDGATRKKTTEMVVQNDAQINPKRDVATHTTIAFRPTPHEKLGEVFAVTSKNGVIFGTTGLALFVDGAPQIDGIPPNWDLPGFDPHQIAWLTDSDGTNRLIATNGEETRYRRVGAKGLPIEGAGFAGWKEYRHRQTVLSALPGQDAVLCRFNNGTVAGRDTFDLWRINPLGDASNPNEWRRLSGHQSRPTLSAVSKDGKHFVTCDEGGTIIVWDGDTFQEKSRVEYGPGFVQLAFAPDGKTLALLRATGITMLGGPANRSGTSFELFIVDVTDLPTKPTSTWKGANLLNGSLNVPVSLTFSPDGNTLLGAFGDPYPVDQRVYPVQKPMGVRVWTRTEKIIAPVPKVEKDEGVFWVWDSKSAKLVAYSPDGKKETELSLKANQNFAGFSHDGGLLLFLAKKGELTNDKDGLTLHIGKPGQLAEAVDTGIKYRDNETYYLTRDQSRVLRCEVVAATGYGLGEKFQPMSYKHSIYDLTAKSESVIELEPSIHIIQESHDRKEWIAVDYNYTEKNIPPFRWLRIPKTGGKPIPICDTRNFFYCKMSTNGQSYLGIESSLGFEAPFPFKQEMKGMSLYHVNAEGKLTEIEQFHDGEHRNLVWSPNSKQYAVKKKDDAGVFVGDIEGKNRKKLFEIPGAGKETHLIGWFPKASVSKAK